jgi:ABC-type antimicrobial peptide transport system permease subunit
VRNTISSVDNSLPLFDFKTQKQAIDEQLVTERTLARLSGLFGFVALLLACMGLYGLLAYDVAQRTREVGIRMALGARRFDVIGIIVQRGLSIAAADALAGATLGFVLVRLAKAILFGVGVFDPATFSIVLGLLLVVALAACLIPARQAASVDPTISLRCE